MVRKVYLIPIITLPLIVLCAVSVFGQASDEDISIAAEEMLVEDAVDSDELPVDEGLELMTMPGMDLPDLEEEQEEESSTEDEAPPLPAETVLPVEEDLPELPKIEDVPVIEEDSAPDPEPELPIEENMPGLPTVTDMAADALEGDAIPVEAPEIEEGPELPVVEAPEIEEVAELPVTEDVPEVEEVPELPVEEPPAVEEVAELPVEEAIPEVEPAPVVELEPLVEPLPEREPVPEVEPPPIDPIPGIEPSPEPAPQVESAFLGSEAMVEGAVQEAISEGPEPVPNLSTLEVDPRVAEVSAALTQEAIRRKAYETHALQTLLEAEIAMQDELYEKALKLYEEARRYLGMREELEPERQRIMNGLAASCYEQAKIYWQEKEWEKAKNMAKAATRYGHPDGMKLLELIEDDQMRPPPPPPKRKETSRRYSTNEMDDNGQLKTQGYTELKADMTRRFEMGKQFFQTKEYEKAQEIFESILKYDPHNVEAIRLLEKVARRLHDTGQMERETTRREMVADVINTWNPRDYGKNEEDYVRTRSPRGDSDVTRTDSDKERESIMKKLKTIVIPEIDFRQANINDVIGFLQEQSVTFDKDEKSQRKGVNIILNLGTRDPGAGGMADAPAAGPADPFAAAAEPAAAPIGGASDVPLITFTARYISLLEALDIVTSVANLKHRIKGSTVMVVPIDDPEQEIVHRMYNVLSDISSKIEALAPAAPAATGGGGFGGGFGGGGGDGATIDATGLGTGDRADWKEFFAGFGVGWPRGSSITYMPAVGKIFVANTPDNLLLFERILDVFNVQPSQIEIEARFVEIQQVDLDSLGIEWMLTDDWEMKQKSGQGMIPASQRQRVVMGENANAGGFTKGNRFLSDLQQSSILSVTGADDIMSVASVLTNPELSMVLHMLSQKGNADLLSAPKVTTKSGQQATIKVVTEFIYPTDFEVTPILATTEGGTSVIVGGIVEPGSFQTREVGVLLEVLPEVSTEGQLINLTLTPQVVGEPEWRNYGSSYIDPFGNYQQLPMEQPFFKVRTVTTSLSIYNGATVVLGGMITENRNDVDDKIPFLGDIPVIGRLFRSKYNHSSKRNLLIFVTARLVDPAGRELKSIESKIEALAGAGAATGGATATVAP